MLTASPAFRPPAQVIRASSGPATRPPRAQASRPCRPRCSRRPHPRRVEMHNGAVVDVQLLVDRGRGAGPVERSRAPPPFTATCLQQGAVRPQRPDVRGRGPFLAPSSAPRRVSTARTPRSTYPNGGSSRARSARGTCAAARVRRFGDRPQRELRAAQLVPAARRAGGGGERRVPAIVYGREASVRAPLNGTDKRGRPARARGRRGVYRPTTGPTARAC